MFIDQYTQYEPYKDDRHCVAAFLPDSIRHQFRLKRSAIRHQQYIIFPSRQWHSVFRSRVQHCSLLQCLEKKKSLNLQEECVDTDCVILILCFLRLTALLYHCFFSHSPCHNRYLSWYGVYTRIPCRYQSVPCVTSRHVTAVSTRNHL